MGKYILHMDVIMSSKFTQRIRQTDTTNMENGHACLVCVEHIPRVRITISMILFRFRNEFEIVLSSSEELFFTRQFFSHYNKYSIIEIKIISIIRKNTTTLENDPFIDEYVQLIYTILK